MVLGFDSETTGLDFWHGCRAFMFQACDGKDTFVWKGKVNPFTRSVKWKQEDLDLIQAKLDAAKVLLFHNAKFDMRALEYAGIKIDHLWDKVMDTSLIAHCISSGDKTALNYLCKKFCNIKIDDEERLRAATERQRRFADKVGWQKAKEGMVTSPGTKKNHLKMDYWMTDGECIEPLPKEYSGGGEVEQYGRRDAFRPWALYKALMPQIHKRGMYYHLMKRMKLLRICYEMESAGLDFRYDEAKRWVMETEQQLYRLSYNIGRKCGIRYPLNLDAAKDKITILYRKLELPIIKKTKTGRPSTEEDVIKELVEQHSDEAKIEGVIPMYQEWVTLNKQLQSVKSYLAYAVEYTDENGLVYHKIHSTIKINGTRSTRQSAENPSTQTIDKRLRELFQPYEGTWMDADYVNIEMRIWAYETGEKTLIDLFELGGSFHGLIFSIIHNDLWIEATDKLEIEQQRAISSDLDWSTPANVAINNEITERVKDLFPDEYGKTKNGNFSAIYGAKAKKINATYGVAGAWELVEERLPGVAAFIRRCAGIIEDNRKATGRSYISTKGGYQLDVDPGAPYKASNLFCQGTAGEVMMDAMINIYESGIPCQILAQVHDSLIIRAEPQYHDAIAELMTQAATQFIPTGPVTYKVLAA